MAENICKQFLEAISLLDDAILQRKSKMDSFDYSRERAEFALNAVIKEKVVFDDISGLKKNNLTLEGQKNEIQQKISALESKSRADRETIFRIEQEITYFAQEKNELLRKKRERFFIQDILCAIFGDSEQEKIDQLGRDIAEKGLQKKDLQKALGKVNDNLSKRQQEIGRLYKKLEGVRERIRLAEEARMQKEKRLQLARKNKRDAEKQIKREQEAADYSFQEKWQSGLGVLEEICRKIRSKQPMLPDLKEEHINGKKAFPDALAFGRLRLSFADWRIYVPRLVAFPFRKALFTGTQSSLEMIHGLILRLMYSLPDSDLEITVFDPCKIGKSMSPFSKLLQNDRPFPEKHFLTGAGEIENALCRLSDYMEDMVQNRFLDGIKSWSDYNDVHKKNRLPFRLLLLFDVPEKLTDRSISFLHSILCHGPGCGILPVLVVDEQRLADKKYQDLQNDVAQYARPVENILGSFFSSRNVNFIKVSEEVEFWPQPHELAPIIEILYRRYGKETSAVQEISALWSEPFWKKKSDSEISVPVGWNKEGVPFIFSCGGTVGSTHHTLIGGRTGSGKSNLLHVFIHSLCHYYPPSELQIYLLDFKQGVEFNAYAVPSLPHAALVATESDPEYGLTVLYHIVGEMESRALEFKTQAVSSISEYRQKSGFVMPRILLIIDEFQMIFSENSNVGSEAEKQMTKLLRQGRSYGIHLLLGTQSLSGVVSQAGSIRGLLSQIGCRIALSCAEEDSIQILGGSNREAAGLKSPPNAILNSDNGNVSGNHFFAFPWACPDLRNKHHQKICELARKKNLAVNTRIYSGGSLPPMPAAEFFAENSPPGGFHQLLPGRELNFISDYFRVILERRYGNNLLICGSDRSFHKSFLFSSLLSLLYDEGVAEIMFFNAGDYELPDLTGLLPETVALTIMDNSWDGTLTDFNEPDTGKSRILILAGLDAARIFQSSSISTYQKPGTPPSPGMQLKALLEEGPGKGLHVIAFADSWQRLNGGFRDLVNLFCLRVGFSMSDVDAHGLVSGGVGGKIAGMERPNRAIFVDRNKNNSVFFRPFGME